MHPYSRNLRRRLLALLLLVQLPVASMWLAADQVLVAAGSTWRYRDTGTDLGTAWRESAFDDSLWAWGPAQLGYGDGDEVTVVGYGPNASAKYITTYFRKNFTVADPGQFTGLNLRVLRDDGVVVYLNGVEIWRNNMPTGTVLFGTLASAAISGAEESTTFVTTSLGVGSLVSGDNVVAVEIHQSAGSSSDLSFDLELSGVTPGQPTVTRGPYLQRVTPNGITARWRTSAATDSRIRYGTSAASLDQTAVVSGSRTEHSVALGGLQPNTLYYYAVGNSAGDLAGGADYFFYTAPTTGATQPMRFWVLGDAGTGTAGQLAVRNAYYNFAGTRYTDLILLLGDNAYNNGTDAEYQSTLFGVYPTIFRSTPSFSTVGNHDTAQLANPDINTTPYFLIFDHPTAAEGGGVPSGSEKYYSFNYGNVHFVSLDSMTTDRSTGGAMLTWLEQDLAQNTADWLIVFFHHPPYTKGSHDSDSLSDSGGRMTDMRANALPILEAYGVDLVLSGHSHSYERSYLIDGHYGTSATFAESMKVDAGNGREDGDGAYGKAAMGPLAHSGTVYVVPGSAGQISGGTLNHPAMHVSLNQLGSFVMDVAGNRLDAKFITSTGVTNDTFTLVKQAAANVPPTVSLVSPAGGSVFDSGVAIPLSAAAADSDGTVDVVEFYADAVLLGTDTTAPYEWTWTGATVGSHQLVAVARDNAGAATQSAAVSVSVVVPAPAPPSGLSAAGTPAGAVNLAWTDNASDEDGFKIERSTDNITFVQVATAAVNATGYTDTTVTGGVTYHYRVRAYGAGGDSAYSNVASATPPVLLPAAPSGLAATSTTKRKANLSWTDNSANETSFKIERSTNGTQWTQIATTGANVTSYVSSGLTSGRTYYFRVRSANAAGDSGYSNVATVVVR